MQHPKPYVNPTPQIVPGHRAKVQIPLALGFIACVGVGIDDAAVTSSASAGLSLMRNRFEENRS